MQEPLEMELGGLEPPTSWVRSNELTRQSLPLGGCD
jgi:hypothetical protein